MAPRRARPALVLVVGRGGWRMVRSAASGGRGPPTLAGRAAWPRGGHAAAARVHGGLRVGHGCAAQAARVLLFASHGPGHDAGGCGVGARVLLAGGGAGVPDWILDMTWRVRPMAGHAYIISQREHVINGHACIRLASVISHLAGHVSVAMAVAGKRGH